MTDQSSEQHAGPSSDPVEPLASAEADLAHVRELLLAAQRGTARPSEIQETLQQYVTNHGPALQAAAAALTDEARQQTLAELYKWRKQLNAQLEARRQSTAKHGGDHPTEA
jgi:hypothetical protein